VQDRRTDRQTDGRTRGVRNAAAHNGGGKRGILLTVRRSFVRRRLSNNTLHIDYLLVGRKQVQMILLGIVNISTPGCPSALFVIVLCLVQ